MPQQHRKHRASYAAIVHNGIDVFRNWVAYRDAFPEYHATGIATVSPAATAWHDLLSEVIVSAQTGFALLLLALGIAVHPLQL